MKSTDLLSQDHKFILRSLDVLEEIAARVHTGDTMNSEDVEFILNFLRVFEDEHHQTKEESALFPELMRCAEFEQKNLRQMLFEHDQERSLVDGLEEAIRTEKGMDFIRYTHRLCSILRNHIYKEEHLLFDIIETHSPKSRMRRSWPNSKNSIGVLEARKNVSYSAVFESWNGNI